MCKVINISDWRQTWREAVTLDSEHSTIQAYVNDATGEVEIVQMNDDGEVIRTTLTKVDALLLASAMTLTRNRAQR